MKNIILSLALVLFSISGVSAQDTPKVKAGITLAADGNYIQAARSGRSADKGTATGKTFTTSKGDKYPVMVSKKGRLFVVRTSKKSGKEYKQYLN